jgi:hypothetical protein
MSQFVKNVWKKYLKTKNNSYFLIKRENANNRNRVKSRHKERKQTDIEILCKGI